MEAQSAWQDGEDETTKPVFVERGRGLDRLGITALSPNHVQTQSLMAESGFNLKFINSEFIELKKNGRTEMI